MSCFCEKYFNNFKCRLSIKRVEKGGSSYGNCIFKIRYLGKDKRIKFFIFSRKIIGVKYI